MAGVCPARDPDIADTSRPAQRRYSLSRPDLRCCERGVVGEACPRRKQPRRQLTGRASSQGSETARFVYEVPR
jgi:hypothetical protein